MEEFKMRFEKVSYEQVKELITKEGYDNLKLPRQGTRYAMGMDFFAADDIIIPAYDAYTIPTGVRWVVNSSQMNKYGLIIVPRSGLGFKHGIRLNNTVGVIDADYQFAKNEGHIMVKLYNPTPKDIKIKRGEAFAQGIIMPYVICDGAHSDELRVGGFGSTTNPNAVETAERFNRSLT